MREARDGDLHGEAARTAEGLGLEPAGFIPTLRRYAQSFFTMVGEVHRIDLESARRGYTRCPGRRAARRLYRPVEDGAAGHASA